jgi:hypothetical protein
MSVNYCCCRRRSVKIACMSFLIKSHDHKAERDHTQKINITPNKFDNKENGNQLTEINSQGHRQKMNCEVFMRKRKKIF